ncbi:MAG: hypothetical protein HKO72_03050 [Flavobacteriaceae bacterium]|nr:hypothetical protein [Bacteroidia bacterium]NNL60299.1 hypothetical protein [Flavobacteriaceae bacterium]
MSKTVGLFHWLPRILCILAILFISLFALDAFSHGESTWDQIIGFLMHLIPSFVLIGILLVAWKWEKIGGIIFILLGLGLSPFIFNHNYAMNNSISMSLGIIALITIPFMVLGILFLVSHYRKKKDLNQ